MSIVVSLLKTLRFILGHPFNRGRPFNALAKYAAWQVRSRLQDEISVDWIAATKLVARRGMTGATGNIYCGLHENRDMSFLLHILRPGDVFVDVGANIGSYTVLASGVCGARSIAIEPDAGTARRLARNIAANGIETLVDVHQTAVGDATGRIAFTLGQDTTNRVATDADACVQTVLMARLDDILKDIDPILIKVDVEGYETTALRGAQEVLAKRSLLAVLLETVEPEAVSSLTRLGFARIGYDAATRRFEDETEPGPNVLFVRDQEALQDRLRTAPERTFRGRTI